jgi:LacI family transcriptional regulator
VRQTTDKNRKKADIFAVARIAKVSPSTVSRSFNHPQLVKATTRKKIDSAVRRLGYSVTVPRRRSTGSEAELSA